MCNLKTDIPTTMMEMHTYILWLENCYTCDYDKIVYVYNTAPKMYHCDEKCMLIKKPCKALTTLTQN